MRAMRVTSFMWLALLRPSCAIRVTPELEPGSTQEDHNSVLSPESHVKLKELLARKRLADVELKAFALFDAAGKASVLDWSWSGSSLNPVKGNLVPRYRILYSHFLYGVMARLQAAAMLVSCSSSIQKGSLPQKVWQDGFCADVPKVTWTHVTARVKAALPKSASEFERAVKERCQKLTDPSYSRSPGSTSLRLDNVEGDAPVSDNLQLALNGLNYVVHSEPRKDDSTRLYSLGKGNEDDILYDLTSAAKAFGEYARSLEREGKGTLEMMQNAAVKARAELTKFQGKTADGEDVDVDGSGSDIDGFTFNKLLVDVTGVLYQSSNDVDYNELGEKRGDSSTRQPGIIYHVKQLIAAVKAAQGIAYQVT